MTRKGFVYDTVSRGDPGDVSPESSNYANVVDEGDLTDGLFSSNISGLSSGTTYYFRAFGYDDTTYEYGEELSFTTLSEVFDVVIVSATTPVAQGSTLEVEVDITNNGDANGTQDITLSFSTENNVVDTQSVTLDVGVTERITLSYTVPSDETTSNHTLWVKSEDETDTTTIEVEEFTPATLTTRRIRNTSVSGQGDLSTEVTLVDVSSVSVGFRYKKSSGSSWVETSTEVVSSDGLVTITISGLDSVDYDTQSFFEYDGERVYGDVLTFPVGSPARMFDNGVKRFDLGYDSSQEEILFEEDF